ncbi:hypothetical protein B0H65DRAFT_474722, partial [Neurospora tetraspora]
MMLKLVLFFFWLLVARGSVVVVCGLFVLDYESGNVGTVGFVLWMRDMPSLFSAVYLLFGCTAFYSD